MARRLGRALGAIRACSSSRSSRLASGSPPDRWWSWGRRWWRRRYRRRPVRCGSVWSRLPLAVFAASPVTAAAAAATGVLAFLVFDGFLVNSLGQLSWHGAADGWRLLTLAVAVAAGFIAGVAYRAVSRWLRWRRWTLWITAQARQADGLFDDEQPARPRVFVLHTRGLTHG